MVESVFRHPGPVWFVNGGAWNQFRPHDKHGRELFLSPDKGMILKAEKVEAEIPQSWTEGSAWVNFFSTVEPGEYVRFAAILAVGSYLDDWDRLWAWAIQEFVSGPNGYSERERCPHSPYFTYVIAEARKIATSLGLNDRDLTFPGQYVYDVVNGIAVCVDYGRVLK